MGNDAISEDEGRYWNLQGYEHVYGVNKKLSYTDAARCFIRAINKKNAYAVYNLSLLVDDQLVKLSEEDAKILTEARNDPAIQTKIDSISTDPSKVSEMIIYSSKYFDEEEWSISGLCANFRNKMTDRIITAIKRKKTILVIPDNDEGLSVLLRNGWIIGLYSEQTYHLLLDEKDLMNIGVHSPKAFIKKHNFKDSNEKKQWFDKEFNKVIQLIP